MQIKAVINESVPIWAKQKKIFKENLETSSFSSAFPTKKKIAHMYRKEVQRYSLLKLSSSLLLLRPHYSTNLAVNL